MRRERLLLPAVILLSLAAIARPAAAAWPHDAYANVAVSTATSDQLNPNITSDGAGGAIITWYDYRSGSGYDIYAQRVSAAGTPLWTANGVALCTATGDQYTPTITSDGVGGAVVTWQDARSGTSLDIYAQRISAAGTPLWTANGVALCSATGDQQNTAITSDGAAGAVVTWYDYRSGIADIYAQRVSAAGTPLWTANGVALCTAAGAQQYPTITSDGAGGAIVTWVDLRGPNYDIYAQRISAAGTPLWLANGVALCTATGTQTIPTIASDGAGGAIVAWYDSRSGTYDTYAQRVSAAGTALWTINGVALCTAVNDQYSVTLVPDGSGGAIFAWIDGRSGAGTDIYGQRLSASGTPLWPANGVALCSAASSQYSPVVASDGVGGGIVTWYDYRNGTNYDIYAQRVSAAGTVLWTPDGVAVSSAAVDQQLPTITSDGAGGAIITWYDYRGGANTDIYAQRVDPFGKLGNPEPVITSVRDFPNDQGGKVRLAWDASWLDGANDPDMNYYDVFRSVPPNTAQQAVARGTAHVMRPGETPVPGSAAYLYTAQGYAWEFMQSYSAQHFITSYGSVQATNCDSIANSNPTTAFMVVARGYAGKYWMSAPASGYSVDNLPPSTPAPFTGQYAAGSTKLHWDRNNEADLAGYKLYRGSNAAFVPSAGNLVSTLADTGYVDAAAAPYIYKLTAVDSHGNESPVATLTPTGTLGVGDGAALELAFAAPSPNPARGSTTLEFTLPQSGHVRLSVFDAAGRRVQTLHDGEMAAGAHREAFALRDDAGRDLAAGLYLVRLETAGRVITRRLAAVR